MSQMSLFDALHRPPVVRPVDTSIEFARPEPDTYLFLPHPRLAWHRAEICLHPWGDLWMWSTCWGLDGSGGGYAFSPKWGKFADSKDDALFYAIRELREKIERETCDASNAIRKWLDGLQ